MSNICSSAVKLIGNTPLLRLERLEEHLNLPVILLAKLECFNLSGSVKDRVAKAILDDAAQRGLLHENSVILEATSGNTGIGLAAVGAAMGYRTILIMPDTMSKERRALLSAYGAELILTDGALGMSGAVQKAEELHHKLKESILANQFANPVNPFIHYTSTGPELWHDAEGSIDIFVAGVGTGGTITGVGQFLKEKNPDIRIIAVEPETSPMLSKGYAGAHGIQGIGANFFPELLDPSIYDEVLSVSENSASSFAQLIAKKEGVLVGISSGAALSAAVQLASRPENTGKTISMLFPDSGDRYLSQISS